MDEVRILATGLGFPEGPVAMPDGSVILVEIARQTLTRVMPDGKQHVIAKLGGGPNGAAMGPNGKIYVTNNGGFNWIERPGGRLFPGTVSADYKGGSIQVVDPESGKFETLYDSCNGRKLNGPNDLVFDDAGGFWFTDLGKTRERDTDRVHPSHPRHGTSPTAAEESRTVAHPLETPPRQEGTLSRHLR
jgi:gluconolactonase